jgi:hypothetical protein
MAGDSRAICAECGHVHAWHDRDAARSMRSGELASDRRCYREVGGAGCRCSGFRDSGEVAISGLRAIPGRGGRSVVTAGLVTLLLVVMGLGLLYAYRSQTPSVTPVVYSEAVREINAGQVKKITITANKATLELHNNDKQQLTLPDRPETFQKLLDDYNLANPSRQIVIDYQPESATFSVILSILLSLLPVFLIGAFFLYLTSRLRPR